MDHHSVGLHEGRFACQITNVNRNFWNIPGNGNAVTNPISVYDQNFNSNSRDRKFS